ncbi:ArsR/SmtB family transcription factor [Streptomyces azureus]|uniref:ArsR/SmtB family transcription factor n=1 Tax=Streptomyces azureus TaxID=146537 RepID=UPI001F1DA9CB|nr:helix-turn-helix transcriptional regulator [Streptomyces azureus]
MKAVAHHQPVTVGELTKVFGLPESTVQRTLVSLNEAGRPRANRQDTTPLGDRRPGARRTSGGALGIEPVRGGEGAHDPSRRPGHGSSPVPARRSGRRRPW